MLKNQRKPGGRGKGGEQTGGLNNREKSNFRTVS